MLFVASDALLPHCTIGYARASIRNKERVVASQANVTARPFQITAGEAGLRLAPENLWQAINPWTFAFTGDQVGLINISIGDTKHPEVEREILDEVGSYGRQLGHIGDALEVLIGKFDQTGLEQPQKDALTILLGELAEIRKVKRRTLDSGKA
jgi:hypothetical protein